MERKIRAILKPNRIAILGYGREGRSSYKFIRNYYPEKEIGIFDKSEGVKNDNLLSNDRNCIIYAGAHYLEHISGYDLVIKSPGISYKEIEGIEFKGKIHSQSGIFLELFAGQIIGITGTKGKSTTSSI